MVRDPRQLRPLGQQSAGKQPQHSSSEDPGERPPHVERAGLGIREQERDPGPSAPQINVVAYRTEHQRRSKWL